MSSHLDASGKAVMIDVGGKNVTHRIAMAEGRLVTTAAVTQAIRDNALKKGDALAVARVAGIMAAKNTSRTIPLCHDIPLSSCGIDFEIGDGDIRVVCSVVCDAKTGAEMEALSGVGTALLTLYDMAKSIDREMEITGVRVLKKSGGKSGDYERAGRAPTTPGRKA